MPFWIKEASDSLLAALQKKDFEAFLAALERGAPLDEPDSSGDFPVFQACALDAPIFLKELLRRGADCELAPAGAAPETPLALCAALGHLECAELLIESGASGKALNSCGETLCHLACLAPDPLASFLFFERQGADSRALDAAGSDCLFWACQNRHGAQLASALCARGWDLARVNNHGLCSLGAAVGAQNLPVCQILLSFGADAFLEGAPGMSASALASSRAQEHPGLARLFRALDEERALAQALAD